MLQPIYVFGKIQRGSHGKKLDPIQELTSREDIAYSNSVQNESQRIL